MKPKPRIVPIAKAEHPALRSARLCIARHLRTLPPAAVFSLASLVEKLATGEDRHWYLSADNALANPQQFAPGRFVSTKVRP